MVPAHLLPTAATIVTVDTCVNDHQRAVPIIQSGINNLTVVCSDGSSEWSSSPAVSVLAISFPFMLTQHHMAVSIKYDISLVTLKCNHQPAWT